MNREVLFDSDSLSDFSRVFEIPPAGELTAVVLGFANDEDYVHFEMIHAPSIKVDPCGCPPVDFQPPVVTNKAILQINGKPVILNRQNPFAVLVAPQGQPLRAVRHIAHEEDQPAFRMTIADTTTRKIFPEMLGLMDKEIDYVPGIAETGRGYND
ncbi:MAG: hypothetical protein NC080_07495 [Paraprevotella sp.]|nr:hypothetical protein [Paraprevotella sp.]